MENTSEKVAELLRKVLALDTIDFSAAVGAPSRWDSLRHMRVLVAVEKEFLVKIPSEKYAELTSLEKISVFLKANMRG